VSSAGSAWAQPAEDARQLYLNARFQEAVEAFDAVLVAEGVTRADVVESHRHLTALHVLLGDATQASRHARLAVALEPAVQAPEGAPPQVTQALDAARSELGGAASLSIAPEGEVVAGESVRAVAELTPSPEGLAASVFVRCTAGSGAPVEGTAAPPRVAVEVPTTEEDDAVACRAAARTSAGVDLIVAEQSILLEGGSGTGYGGPADDGGGLPWIWIGVGAGALVLAGVLVAVLATSGGGDPSIDEASVEW
jgi:hypothetical protein